LSSVFVTEVFSAIQGEASLVGERQVFVRLAGCNIRCAYCDQPEALEKLAGPCRIERTPGRRDWEVVESPLPVEVVAGATERLWHALPHHSVSLTGGEPLFQREAPALAAALAGRGLPLYLETNGMLAAALGRMAPYLAHVSMDLKLASVDGEEVPLATHERFLALAAASVPDVFCKIVVGASTSVDELEAAVAMVARTAPAAEIFPARHPLRRGARGAGAGAGPRDAGGGSAPAPARARGAADPQGDRPAVRCPVGSIVSTGRTEPGGWCSH
jgi:7-carboxy-7-deazaguanine synthase